MRISISKQIAIALALALWNLSGPLPAQEVSGYFDYDPVTGSLSFDNLLPDNPLTTVRLVSKSGVYLGERPETQSVFDSYSKHLFFTLTSEGVISPDYGPLMSPGLEPALLAEDLCLSGSRLPSGRLENVELRVGDQTWPIAAPGVRKCPDVPHIPRRTIEPIDFYLDYDPVTGNLSVDSTNQPINGFVLRTPVGHKTEFFVGEPPDLPQGDNALQNSVVFRGSTFSYINIGGFETVDLGPIAPPGLSAADLASDLCYKSRTIEAESTGSLFVRSGDEIHKMGCELKPTRSPEVAELQLNQIVDDTVDVGVIIDPDDGSLIVYVPEISDGASKPLTRIEIRSEQSLFIPGAQSDGTLDGAFDSLTQNELIKSDFNGFVTVDFGPILTGEDSLDDLTNSLQVSGSFADGSQIESIQIARFATVPEPTAGYLFVMALASLFLFRRPGAIQVISRGCEIQ